MEEEIIRLTDLWYELVNLDHHKDRDCHFYINTVYSYGEKPYYRIEHYGYIGEELEGDYETYEEAEIELVKKIKGLFAKEEKWAKTALENISAYKEDPEMIDRAKEIIKITAKI